MEAVIPSQFFFRWALACQPLPTSKARSDAARVLGNKHRLPSLGLMDRQPHPFDVAIAWSSLGLYFQIETTAKQKTLVGDAERPNQGDSFALWIDTRDTRQIHRATPFCQHFLIGLSDKPSAGTPFVQRHAIPRSIENTPTLDLSQIRLQMFAQDEDGDWVESASCKGVSNYRLCVFLPAKAIHGFDPDVNRRLGFFYRIRDAELGDQLLVSGRELPYWEDPSIWATLELRS